MLDSSIEDVVFSYCKNGEFSDTKKTISVHRPWCDAAEILEMFGKDHGIMVDRIQEM